jgi:hypothetical protein
VPDKTIIIS